MQKPMTTKDMKYPEGLSFAVSFVNLRVLRGLWFSAGAHYPNFRV